MTRLWLDSASATADAIAEYACVMASLLKSPEAVRAAAPNVSAKVSDAKLTASQRSTARWANVDFPAPGMPQRMRRRCLCMREFTSLRPYDVVGAVEQRLRNGDAEAPRGTQIDSQLEFSQQHDRKSLGRLFVENEAGVSAGELIAIQ